KLSGVGLLRRWEITWGDLREWPGRVWLWELEKSSKMLRVVLGAADVESQRRVVLGAANVES
ncbi:hypothetical protein B0H10DRAFT_2127063, partial [Mycena sp. CBHHK59/15]